MGLLQRLRGLGPRLARPKTFLGIISLQMGTEIIAVLLFFNKLTGAYGLLAILTGFHLSAMQLSAYLYSLAILVLLVVCIPHIRRETPLPNLALAWAYAVDTLLNALITASFAVSWYLSSTTAAAAAAAAAASAPSVASTAATAAAAAAATAVPPPATATAAAAAAVASVASVLASALPLALRADAGTADAGSSGAEAAPTSPEPTSAAGAGGWMGAHETAASLTLIVLVTVVRFYFCYVVIAHTRRALQRYGDHVVESAAAADGALDEDEDDGDKAGHDERKAVGDDNAGEGKSERDHRGGGGGGGDDDDDDDEDNDDEEAGLKSGKRASRRDRDRRRRRRTPRSVAYAHRRGGGPSAISTVSKNPFAAGSPAGEGWRGKVGRALVRVGQGFWLGREKDDGWTRDTQARFRSASSTL